MSQTRKAALVVAMLVVSAVAVASASAALPEFHGPFPNPFTALQLTKGTLLTVAEREVSCEHGSAAGTVNGPKDVLVNSIKYTGCKSTKFGGGECKSGATKGEIATLALLGLLGYIKLSPPLVGLLFEPDGSVNHFASFECATLIGAEHLTVRGTVICHLSPVKTATTEYHLECTANKGVQTPLSFADASTKDTLETKGEGPENFAFEQSGVTALSDVFVEKLTEILA